MEPAQTIMAAASERWAGMYTVGGLLFLGSCVLLLLHCASSSERKKRRRVENSDVTGAGDVLLKNVGKNDDVINTQNRKGQGGPKKQPKKKMAEVKTLPAVTIVITPPSPQPDQRSLNDAASPNDDHAAKPTSENATTENNDVRGHDVIRGEDDANRRVPCNNGGGGGKMSSSTTSLSGIGDVNFVTSEEVSSEERGEELPLEDVEPEPRPRLASMEPGTPKSGICIVAVDRTGDVQSGDPVP